MELVKQDAFKEFVVVVDHGGESFDDGHDNEQTDFGVVFAHSEERSDPEFVECGVVACSDSDESFAAHEEGELPEALRGSKPADESGLVVVIIDEKFNFPVADDVECFSGFILIKEYIALFAGAQVDVLDDNGEVFVGEVVEEGAMSEDLECVLLVN